MMLTRNNNDLEAMRREMSRLFEGGRGASSYGRAGQNTGNSGDKDGSALRAWAPAVDVTENEHEIVIHAELPGMKKEEIDIQLTGETLTLRGERRQQEAQRGENYHRIERQYGQFLRTFQIEAPIDSSKVSASYEYGVLTVHLPKQEALKPRQIEINVK